MKKGLELYIKQIEDICMNELNKHIDLVVKNLEEGLKNNETYTGIKSFLNEIGNQVESFKIKFSYFIGIF